MSPGPQPGRGQRAWTAAAWAGVAVLPLLLLAVVRLWESLDAAWENDPAHFWLVLAASAVAVALGYTVSEAARRRRDARLFLVSMGFLFSAGFLGLHALATPGVLLGANSGFELATPVGLALGGAFVAVSGVELSERAADAVIRRSPLMLTAAVLVIVVWAAVSLLGVPPLDDPLQEEELNGWQNVLGVVGVALYLAGVLGYARIYRRRRARFAFAVVFGLVFLAEAMVVVAFAENWRVSWWEWHVLMLGAFLVIALSARSEWHEERFSALYLDQTLAGVREASVVFADLQGYTAFSERSDPGQVNEMLNAYFSRLVPAMQQAGGEVNQIIGDALMVVFNKAGDQPDHAVLAAASALTLQREAQEVAREHPDWPRFRVGVNSGEVVAGVVGGRGHRKHGLVGDTVNLAARLQSIAAVDQVVIGEGTRRRLPPGAQLRPLEPTKVKGKQDPVAAYTLVSLPLAEPG